MTTSPFSAQRRSSAQRRRVDTPPAARTATASATPTRLISETAHDLRAPLTTIRESVRLVRDGQLGAIGQQQRECLSAALDQCECVDQMVGEMLRLDQQQRGSVAAPVRRWVPIQEVRRAVDETLQPWAVPKRVCVLWDDVDEPNLSLFGDPLLLRRLLVNLLVNSIRATAEGGSVLVRLAPQRGGEAVRVSVIDQGRGISEAELHEVAQRQASEATSSGLGLIICRQLAALHFSPLHIRSRLGTGTEVSFELPSGGPTSVAAYWSRWRVAQRTPGKRAPRHAELGSREPAAARAPRAGRRGRLTPPSVQVELPCDQVRPACQQRLVAVVLTLGATMRRDSADAFDRILQQQQQTLDLVYRVEPRRWIWLVDSDLRDFGAHRERIAEVAGAHIENLRLSWSEPQSIPIDERRTAAQVSDLLVRQTLAQCTQASAGDTDQVRLGTAPLSASPAASDRLDQQLHRLSSRMSDQSVRLRRQSLAIRPIDDGSSARSDGP